MSRRRGLLAVALAATLFAAWFAPAMDDEAVLPAPRREKPASAGADDRPPARQAAAAARGEVLSIRSREAEDDAADLRVFAATQWRAAAQKPRSEASPPAVSAPVKAQAPPLPFRVLGRYEAAGKEYVFLQHQEDNLVVRVGDTIGNLYRVEELKGRSLMLRYLPLGDLQTLDLGGQ